jgi:hypothetical protein
MTVPNSKVLVNSIEASDPVGPVTVSMGASVTGGSLTINGNANFSSGIVTTTQHSGTSVNISGIMTASSFIGSASNMSSLPVIDNGKAIAFTLIG